MKQKGKKREEIEERKGLKGKKRKIEGNNKNYINRTKKYILNLHFHLRIFLL